MIFFFFLCVENSMSMPNHEFKDNYLSFDVIEKKKFNLKKKPFNLLFFFYHRHEIDFIIKKKRKIKCFDFLSFRRSRDAESLENIAARSSDSAPSTPEDNINVVVR